MTKDFIALFAMCMAMCGLAVTPANTTTEEWQTFLNANGYYLFTFQLKDTTDKTTYVQPVVIRGSYGKVDEIANITPYPLPSKQNISIGIKMAPYDSVYNLTVFSRGAFSFSSPKRDLKPVMHDNELKYSYVVREVENTSDKIQEDVIPLVFLASFFIDENGILRCCGDDKEIRELSPDYMIFGIKIFKQ